MESIMHFIKHFLGLCGESHPSVIVSGFAIFSLLGLYINHIINYIKNKLGG